jgi:hypothetical protein
MCLAVGLIGLALVWYDLAQPKGLYGVNQYDDGVYFGAAVRLINGALPYRDFVFLQPPGIAVIGAPIAWLTHADTREGLALARMLTALIAGLNVFLAAWLVRHKGVLASAVAGLALAIYPTAFFADHSFLLEPYLIFGCLLGACAIFSRGRLATPWRIALGGVAFGVAGSVKLWAIVPVIVLAICLLPRLKRAVLAFVGGVAIGFGAVCLPFFISAPHRFIADIFSSQIGRNAANTRFSVRIWSLVGLRGFSRSVAFSPSGILPDVIGALIVAVVLGGLVVALRSRRISRLELYVFASCVAIVAALFVPAQFFSHYTYVTGAFVAVALGLSAAYLSAPLRSLLAHRRRRPVVAIASGLLLVVGFGGAAAITATEVGFDTWALQGTVDPGASIARAIPAGSCVISDAASLAIAGSRFAAPPGCPVFVDSTGTWIEIDPNNPPAPHIEHPQMPVSLVASWKNWFSRADYVVLSAPYSFRIPWTPALRAYFQANYHVVPAANALIYQHLRRVATPVSKTPFRPASKA